MKNVTKLLFFTVFCAVIVSVTLSEKSDFVPNISILKLSVASADDGESSTNCSRIKTYCSCYDGNTWRGMSVSACEDYTAVPPMVCDHCGTSSCPPGSQCR